MRLVIHAGPRKTATTSFQRGCDLARSAGVLQQVLYPRLRVEGRPVFQHSPLLWALQVGRHEAVLSALRIMHQEACEAGCKAVLMSGEDFENFLIDEVNHRHFEQLALQAGFHAPEWIWVERDPVDRLESVYSEAAKHGLVASIQAWTASVRRTGWFAMSTETCHSLMVIDLRRCLPSFVDRTLGSVQLIPFESFVATQPVGSDLLMRCFGSQWLQASEPDNVRLRPEQIERRYLASFLNSGLISENDCVAVEEELAALAPMFERIVARRQTWLKNELEDLRVFFRDRPV